MTPNSNNTPLIPRGDYSPEVRERINRLKKEADCLFSLGSIRERCQRAMIAFLNGNQTSPFAEWGAQLSYNHEFRFAQSLTMSYKSTKDDMLNWASGCMDDYLLQEIHEERNRIIEKFARMKIASRWYQIKDDDETWRVFSRNVPYGEIGREEEINQFFTTLDKICILTDILNGHASEYGLEVDYSKAVKQEKNIEPTVAEAIREQTELLKKMAEMPRMQNNINVEFVQKKETNIDKNYAPNIEHNGGTLTLPNVGEDMLALNEK